MNEYGARVITAPAEPGQVRKVGHLEIPANRFERIGPDPLPPLDVELVQIERTPEGRLLCWRGDPWMPGTGCNGCRFQGSRWGEGCVSRYEAEYARIPKQPRPPRSRAIKPEMTAAQKARRKELRRAYRRTYENKHLVANATPEEAEKIRAKWRLKAKRKNARRKAARLALQASPDTPDTVSNS